MRMSGCGREEGGGTKIVEESPLLAVCECVLT